MQVIHHYNGVYPFSLQQQSDKTYLQVLKQNLNQEEMSLYKKKFKIIKEMDHTNIIKLVKIYKQQSTLHLLYQYLGLSLEQYVQHRSQHFKQNAHQQLKEIYTHFVATLNKIVDILIGLDIKTDIMIQNIAVLNVQSFHLKIFIDPDAQIIQQNQTNLLTNQQNNKKATNKNKQSLHDFYQAQKKRLTLQLQQMLQKYFGKSYTVSQLNRPNFIIDGCKLVFLNNTDPRKIDKEHRNQLVTQITHKKQPINIQARQDNLDGSPLRYEKTEKRDLKEKTMRKIEQIKNVLNRFQNKPMQFIHQDYKHYPDKDEVILRNQQMTTDKTSFQQENQYLESLEKQLQKNAEQKKKRRQSEEKRADIIKQLNELQQKNRGQPSQRSSDLKGLQRQRHSLKDVKFFMSKDDTDKSRNSDDVVIKNEQKKEEKTNKYKMKIITSHQIEIQGSGDPQHKQIDKETLENIKSGKISTSELSQKYQRPKTFKVEDQQTVDARREANNGKINSRNSDIACKSKKINEIIEKINSKANINAPTNTNQPKVSVEDKQAEPLEHTTESYYEKIQSAKQKAQQVLKQYAKKKQ